METIESTPSATEAPADPPDDALCATLDDSPAEPLAGDLLDAVPPGAQPTEEELLEQLRDWRRLVVVRVGVPLEAILTVLAAFAIEAALLGLGYLMIWAGTNFLPAGGGGVKTYTVLSVDIDDGGRGTGGAPRGSAPTVSETEVCWRGPGSIVEPPAAASAGSVFIPETKEPTDTRPVAMLPDEPSGLIAMNANVDSGVPKVRPRPRIRQTVAEGPRVDNIVPPANVSGAADAHSGAAGAPSGAAGGRNAVASTLGPGDGGGEDELVQFTKPGKGGGVGKGIGRGTGSGSDRGPSVAGSAPMVLWQPRLDLPAQYRYAWKQVKRAVIFDLTVDPAGHLSALKIKQSSGDPELDAILKEHVRKIKFRPAYEAGRPVASPFVFSFGDDEGDK